MLGVLLGEKLDELLQETMQVSTPRISVCTRDLLLQVREEGDQERERLEGVAREKKGLEQQLDQVPAAERDGNEQSRSMRIRPWLHSSCEKWGVSETMILTALHNGQKHTQ